MTPKNQSSRRDDIILFALVSFALFGPLLLLASKAYIDAPPLQSNVSLLLISLLSFAGIFMVMGIRSKGKLLGASIDKRNRYSLSRLQISLWTVLVLASIVSALSINAFQSSDGELPELNIDWTLITLLGLSTVSSIAGPSALAPKTTEPASLTDQINVYGKSHTKGKVLINLTPANARLSNFVSGEEAGNFGTIDLARLQMLLITLVVWVVHLTYLITKFNVADGAINKFPTFDTTMLTLIGASHAGYVSGKLIPHGTEDPAPAAQVPPKISPLKLKAEILDRELMETMGVVLPPAQLAAGQGGFSNQIDHILARSYSALPGDAGASAALWQAGPLAERQVPNLDDMPPPELVNRVKQKLIAKFSPLEPPFSDGDDWTSDDNEALNAALKKIGLQRMGFDERIVHALEEVLEAIEYIDDAQG